MLGLAATALVTSRVRVLVMQTCGHGKYEKILKITRSANKRWAALREFDYMSVIGVYEGGQEWLSTYNKALIVARELNASSYDLVFYMDTDAVVSNPSYDVRAMMHGALIAAGRGGNNGPWDINIGVALWNLRHPRAAAIVDEWVIGCKTMIESTLKGHMYGDDQSVLHAVLRRELKFQGIDTVNYTAAARKLITDLPHAPHLHHILRPRSDDWTGNSVVDRSKVAQRLNSSMKWIETRMPGDRR